jgi:hypothetical protein
MRLFDPLGQQLGFLGTRDEFDDGWRGNGWDNVAYHRDIAGGQRPAWQIYGVEDDSEFGNGQVLETEASLEHGASGSPFFEWFDNGTQVQVVAVVAAGAGFGGDCDNALSGGPHMNDLVGWGRQNWP